MATYAARATAIADAVINSTATLAQKKRMAKAFAPHLSDEATNAEIAEVFVKAIRHHILGQVDSYESQAAIIAARDATVAAVQTDFPEAP